MRRSAGAPPREREAARVAGFWMPRAIAGPFRPTYALPASGRSGNFRDRGGLHWGLRLMYGTHVRAVRSRPRRDESGGLHPTRCASLFRHQPLRDLADECVVSVRRTIRDGSGHRRILCAGDRTLEGSLRRTLTIQYGVRCVTRPFSRSATNFAACLAASRREQCRLWSDHSRSEPRRHVSVTA